MSFKDEVLEKHIGGKIEIRSKIPITNQKDLSIAYTPGVALVCKEIENNNELAYKYTSKGNTVAVITDGSAVLGLGNIGSLAGLPVMEGKSILLKELAGIDSYPLCLNTQDTEDIIKICKSLEPSLGAINLEDISAPRCVMIERRLEREMNIPVFHDDQHGTSIIVAAAFLNATRLSHKPLSSLKVVISGTGAAGSMIAKMLKRIGVKTIYAYNINGVVDIKKYNEYDFLIKELIDEKTIDTLISHDNTLSSIMKKADAFIGVSAPNIVTKEMVLSMNKDAYIFPMANPTPEISYENAKQKNVLIVGTGRSDYPNQINNILAFPGIFKGALEAKATKINDEMKLAAVYAIANIITDEELTKEYIVPNPFDKRVVANVSKAVKEMAIKTKVIRK